MTQASLDIEQLMIDALDGTITPRNYQILNIYLSQHPDERATFEQMMGFDRTMRAETQQGVPVTMTQQVMAAVSHAKIAQPVLKAPQIVFLIGFPTTLMLMIGIVLVSLYLVTSPVVPQLDFVAGLALLRAISDFIESIGVAAILFLRAIYSIPLAWVITVGLAIVVAAWFRIVVAIWLPLRPISV